MGIVVWRKEVMPDEMLQTVDYNATGLIVRQHQICTNVIKTSREYLGKRFCPRPKGLEAEGSRKCEGRGRRACYG